MARDSAALADIRAAFSDEVLVTSASAAAPALAPAVRMDRAAGDFLGPGNTVRQTIFEIAYSDWPFAGDPARGDGIEEESGIGADWRVIDAVRRDDVEAWHLTVEAANAA